MTRHAFVPVTILALVLGLTASTAAATTAKSRVHIDYRLEGALFIEGSYTYFRIENANGKAILRHRFTDRPRKLTTRLAPGRYTLITYERPCDGNCNYLDPPTARCETRFRVRANSAVDVSVHYDLSKGTCSHMVAHS